MYVCSVGASVWMLNGWIMWEERKILLMLFSMCRYNKMAAMKTVYKELLSFYIAMVVATWRFINFLYPSLHDNDDDDDLLAASLSPSHTTTIQQCERCGTNDDSNFFKLYKARHTILHCICHAETLTSDARYILYVENWKLVTEIHLVNGTCSNSRRSGSGSSNREMQVGR